ncbi:acyl-CoA dehydrogenase [Gonapodya prolifera JEL478]|uniref:Acyl-CoA dehydrogenase n=1 Tax=Gonapodya prolifera (strain JEL478) TaxID=1344416 RepID=A0A139A6L4_GONPJ|nr:acyl-CoA dehydrogenase [Gonapodya prolifera JEL478]|eukprot:KXS12299.1 acyl-CoA dehydrogenase [Gonapodya prolifera JEL478]
MQVFTKSEVAAHNAEGDAWIIVHRKVYDVSKFADAHPGGKRILLKVAGTDATALFDKFHQDPKILRSYGAKLLVGTLASALGLVSAPETPQPIIFEPSKVTKLHRGVDKAGNKLDFMGTMVPIADPMWMQDYYSPYYNASHFRLARALRAFADEVEPEAATWDEVEGSPASHYTRVGQLGILAFEFAPAIYKWLPKDFPRVAGLKDEEIDIFHKLVMKYELSIRGVIPSGMGVIMIAMSPILHHARPEVARRVIYDICSGNAQCCLAVTEPSGGSDTQNLETTAELSDDGKYFIVNGMKKWITNGVRAEYFTTAVRTGGKGGAGISMLLIERKFGGVTTTPMKLQGSWTSGVAFVLFENVRVPVENLLGEVNKGFRTMMHKFNYERLGMIAGCVTAARICYTEGCAHKRKTFGKFLIEHPVLRHKFANMARNIESSQAWLEQLAYQFKMFEDEDKLNERIGGLIAIAKSQATLTFEHAAREASQIFGGLSYTRGGQGGKVEALYRFVRLNSIGGGSEDLLFDFGVRDMLKKAYLMGAMGGRGPSL